MVQSTENSQLTETLHVVHQHYLKNMAEYSRQFFQLMQQQYTLLTHERCTPAMLESFERSMAYFHEHQAQMQRVHEQYLTNLDYSQSTQLMSHSSLTTSETTLLQAAPMPKLPKATEEKTLMKSAMLVSPTPTVKESVPPAISPLPTIKESAPPTVQVSVSMPEPVSDHNELQSLPNESPYESSFVTSESVTTPATDLTPLIQSMLNIVSDKTGYPADMLEIDMDMEADLGIDSIKRVEILGAMQEQFPELPPVNPEELAELRTLAEIVEYMGKQERSPSTP